MKKSILMKYQVSEKVKKLKLLLKHYRKQYSTHKNTETDDAQKL